MNRVRGVWSSRARAGGVVLLGLCVAMLSPQFTRADVPASSPYNPPVDIQVRPGFVLEKALLTERKIPTLLLSKATATAQKKPVVIALHGGGMPELLEAPGMTAKEAWFAAEEFHDAPYTLAEAGCLVVIFDAWWAGERYQPEYMDIVRANVFDALVRGWVETARDVSSVLDALKSDPGADTARVGVCGRSGGAITALMAAHRDKRIVAVTSWAGCADIEAFARTKAPAQVADALIAAAPEAQALLKEFDPIFHVTEFPPRAVLLLNNRSDPAVSSALAEQFYQRLQGAYGTAPELVQFEVRDTPEPTHRMSAQDYLTGCAWLTKQLNP